MGSESQTEEPSSATASGIGAGLVVKPPSGPSMVVVDQRYRGVRREESDGTKPRSDDGKSLTTSSSSRGGNHGRTSDQQNQLKPTTGTKKEKHELAENSFFACLLYEDEEEKPEVHIGDKAEDHGEHKKGIVENIKDKVYGERYSIVADKSEKKKKHRQWHAEWD